MLLHWLTLSLKELEFVKLENERLKNQISELEAKLNKYEHPKNSTNSSVVSSQDPYRKTKSMRGKSKKNKEGKRGIRALD